MTPALFSSLKVLTILPTRQKTEINETKKQTIFTIFTKLFSNSGKNYSTSIKSPNVMLKGVVEELSYLFTSLICGYGNSRRNLAGVLKD